MEDHTQWNHRSDQSSSEPNANPKNNLSATGPYEANEENEPLTPYLYRWSYADQVAFDSAAKAKKKRSGVAVYAVIMTAVFSACLLLLVGVLVWYQSDSYVPPVTELDQPLTTKEVADLVKPSTVLIYSSSATGTKYGTGFFITANGYIATNYHVIEDGTSYSVELYSGKTLTAELVGGVETDDLAVLKVAGTHYPAVTVGDSSKLAVGDVAIAIGHPSGTDGAWTTTQGIISALNRTVTVEEADYFEEISMIQTDAPVNPGNSGGPLCNQYGEVIGIVTRKMTDYEGIGLALPINSAMETLNAIINGTVDSLDSSVSNVRPKLGISVYDIQKGDVYTIGGSQYTAGHTGIIVADVNKNGCAYGILKPADIIFKLDGVTVSAFTEMQNLLYQYKVGDVITLTVWRDGQAVTLEITLSVS